MNLNNLFKKKEETPHCSVVVVAAGSSKRMGSDKIMANLGGMPVLARTLKAFENSKLVDEIIVVTKADRIEEIADACTKFGITKVQKVVCGGSSRMESALAGVSEVNPKAKLIAIHDGARPLVTDLIIKRTVYSAWEHLSAVPVLKNTDTLKEVDEEGVVVNSVDREKVVRVQTPQVFSADLIKGALTKAVTEKLQLTDDCSAMAMMGVKTFTVTGDEDNIKLTTPRDFFIAEAILRNRGEIK